MRKNVEARLRDFVLKARGSQDMGSHNLFSRFYWSIPVIDLTFCSLLYVCIWKLISVSATLLSSYLRFAYEVYFRWARPCPGTRRSTRRTAAASAWTASATCICGKTSTRILNLANTSSVEFCICRGHTQGCAF